MKPHPSAGASLSHTLLPHSTAAERNRGPILAELQRLLARRGTALEIAAGTGQHAEHFAAALPGWSWQPSDADPAALPAIDARCQALANVRPALLLDVCQQPWPDVDAELDLVYAANLLHIAPWPVCAALMQGAAGHLRADGLLLTYGPYLVEGEPTAASNLAFDADLRARNPAWGLRRLSDVQAQAHAAGLRLREAVAMPANNRLLVWARG